MKGYTYILECADGSFYTGSTKHLELRVWQHENLLGANYTKKKCPVKLVYYEEYVRIDEAFYREKQIQGWSHAKKKALIESKPELLIELSKNHTEHGKPTEASHFDKLSALVIEPVPVAEPVEATTEEPIS